MVSAGNVSVRDPSRDNEIEISGARLPNDYAFDFIKHVFTTKQVTN